MHPTYAKNRLGVSRVCFPCAIACIFRERVNQREMAKRAWIKLQQTYTQAKVPRISNSDGPPNKTRPGSCHFRGTLKYTPVHGQTMTFRGRSMAFRGLSTGNPRVVHGPGGTQPQMHIFVNKSNSIPGVPVKSHTHLPGVPNTCVAPASTPPSQAVGLAARKAHSGSGAISSGWIPSSTLRARRWQT